MFIFIFNNTIENSRNSLKLQTGFNAGFLKYIIFVINYNWPHKMYIKANFSLCAKEMWKSLYF